MTDWVDDCWDPSPLSNSAVFGGRDSTPAIQESFLC
jgi:hypothetical protein